MNAPGTIHRLDSPSAEPGNVYFYLEPPTEKAKRYVIKSDLKGSDRLLELLFLAAEHEWGVTPTADQAEVASNTYLVKRLYLDVPQPISPLPPIFQVGATITAGVQLAPTTKGPLEQNSSGNAFGFGQKFVIQALQGEWALLQAESTNYSYWYHIPTFPLAFSG